MDISTCPRIPSEVIYDIFSHLSSPLRVHEAHKFPWYLGQVCSEWRSIFLSMLPYFWYEIQIEWRKDYNQDHYKRVAMMLAFFLDTVSGAPFSFTLYMSILRHDRKNASSTRLILGKLLNHSEQWESISMRLHDREFAMLHRVKNRLPLLQALRLDIVRDPSHEDEDNPLLPHGDIFASAPLLTHIDLGSFSDILWGFNWSLLTSIDLRWSSFSSLVVSALRQTINLEVLVFGVEFYDDDLEDGGLIIKLPRLKYLSVVGVYLLPFLETPALDHLALSDSDEWEITTAFILRSKCELSAFSATDFESMALREILPYMPDIEQLHLNSIGGWAKIFEWLSGTEPRAHTTQPREPPLRRLDELSISFWTLEESDLVALQNMIAHLTVGPSNLGLNTLHIESLDRHPWVRYPWAGLSTVFPAVLEKLESLCRDNGVCLHLYLPPGVCV